MPVLQSICFFTLNYMMLDAWAEMSVLVQRLPVFYKQRVRLLAFRLHCARRGCAFGETGVLEL